MDVLKASAIAEQELELATPHAETQNDAFSLPKTQTTDDLASAISALTTSDTQDSVTDYQDIGSFPDGLENASSQHKELWLKSLFPAIENVQISESLAKAKGDLHTTIDELLNLAFIHDDVEENLHTQKPVRKGIDAFIEGNAKKKKKRQKQRQSVHDEQYESESGLSSGAVTPNVWQKANRDVEFLVSRTNLSVTTINSIYHQNNTDLPRTIQAITVQEAKLQAREIEENEILSLQAEEIIYELGDNLPSQQQIYGALLVCNMMPSAARDLLVEMTKKRYKPQPVAGTLHIDSAAYTPLNLSEDDTPIRKVNPTASIDPGLLTSQITGHTVRANTAFEQASAAYRRGKSNHLMGGAAAYYSQVGHEQSRARKQKLSSAYDALAYQQSTATSVDLHGVTVEHAVRIARQRVQQWWEGLGDRKYVSGGVGRGYTIVTGVGTHSTHQIGKIGPAVSKMLMREGWKVNIQRGEIIVEGKSRR